MEARYSDLQKEKRKNAHTPPPKEKKSWGCLTRVGVGFKKKRKLAVMNEEWYMTHAAVFSQEKYMYVKTEKPIQTTLKWCDLQ